MIKLILIILVVCLAASCTDKTTNSNQLLSSKAVFGEDNREDIYQSLNAKHKEWARSTAAMVDNHVLRKVAAGEPLPTLYEHGVSIVQKGFFLPYKGKICPEMRYAQQPVAANCSGFLVAPDRLVTAGHCMKKQSMCDSFSWVFDFKVDPETGIAAGRNDVYGCAEIVEQNLTTAEAIYDEAELQEYNECVSSAEYIEYMEYVEDYSLYDSNDYNPCGEPPEPIDWDYTNEADYALIRLNRPVIGRTPLKFRTTGEIDLDTELVVIGNPLGLPTKITTSGKVLENKYPHSFSVNIDAFKGNSGSAIFNAETGVVEGILVRGWAPYSYDNDRKCYQISPFDEEGEIHDENINRKDLLTGVNRITSIFSLMSFLVK